MRQYQPNRHFSLRQIKNILHINYLNISCNDCAIWISIFHPKRDDPKFYQPRELGLFQSLMNYQSVMLSETVNINKKVEGSAEYFIIVLTHVMNESQINQVQMWMKRRSNNIVQREMKNRKIVIFIRKIILMYEVSSPSY